MQRQEQNYGNTSSCFIKENMANLTTKFSRRTLPGDVTYQQCLHLQRDLVSLVIYTNKPTRDTKATRKFILR